MKPRGAFRRADGLILPNNLSIAGAAMILQGAMLQTAPSIYAGLVTGTPTPTMTEADMTEPTIGTHGYARVHITNDLTGWPTNGTTGNESWVLSKLMSWVASGGNFDQAIQRLALFSGATKVGARPVYALSAALDSPLTVTPTTPSMDSQFQYTLYLG